MSYNGEYEYNPSWNLVDCPKNSNTGDSSSNPSDFDYIATHIAEKNWDTLDLMKDDLNEIANDFGFFLSIGRSLPNWGSRDPYAEIRCESLGSYRRQGKPSSTRTGTKKLNCPFMIRGYVTGGYWKCYVENGFHNHPPATYLEGHARAARLKNHEVEMVKSLRKTSCTTRAILEAIQEQDDENVSNIKTIHNCVASLKLKETEGRNNIQQLLQMLANEGYVFDYYKNEETDTLESLFFANPDSISLLKAFPDVMLMDCTYKSNRYNLPFLEVVGVSSTTQNFCISFVFMRTEKFDNYIWALHQLRGVLSGCVLPRVIVTYRDMALMNVIAVVFPDSHHLLCTFHIGKNVLKNFQAVIPTDDWEQFTDAWVILVESETIEEYNQNLISFVNSYTNYPTVIDYITNLLNEYNRQFVACFTNHTTHLGNRTTNRVEGQHAALKRYIKTNRGNLETVWSHVHKILKKQFLTIKRELERCKSHFPHEYQIPLFRNLRSSISHKALHTIFEQLQKCDGQFGGNCDCGIKLSHGLPCHHDLSMHNTLGQPLLSEVIHRFWRKLDVHDDIQTNEDDGIDGSINEFKNLYFTKRPAEKYRMKKQLLDISVPSRTAMNEPELRQTKGRPRKGDNSTRIDKSAWEYVEEQVTQQSTTRKNKGKAKVTTDCPPPPPFKYSEQIYSLYHPYIERIDDVVGDGNCGFRVVAKAVGKKMGAEDWFEVRNDLYTELERNVDKYYEFFENNKGFKFMADSLYLADTKMHSARKWMHFPECGFLIASCYNVPVITLHANVGVSGSFFSLYSGPTEVCSPIIMCQVNNNHFIHVIPKERFPMPGVLPFWKRIRSGDAVQWSQYCRQHLSFHKALEKRDPTSKRTNVTIEDPLDVDV